MSCCCERDGGNEIVVVEPKDKSGAVLNSLAVSTAIRERTNESLRDQDVSAYKPGMDAKLKEDVPPAAKDLPPQSTTGEFYVVVFAGKIVVREYPDVSAPMVRNLDSGAKVKCFEWDNRRQWRRVRVNRLVDDSDRETLAHVQETDGWVLIHSQENGVMLELQDSQTKGRASHHSQVTAYSVNASTTESGSVAETAADLKEERAAQEARLNPVNEDEDHRQLQEKPPKAVYELPEPEDRQSMEPMNLQEIAKPSFQGTAAQIFDEIEADIDQMPSLPRRR